VYGQWQDKGTAQGMSARLHQENCSCVWGDMQELLFALLFANTANASYDAGL
jgi:hypothetical protein